MHNVAQVIRECAENDLWVVKPYYSFNASYILICFFPPLRRLLFNISKFEEKVIQIKIALAMGSGADMCTRNGIWWYYGIIDALFIRWYAEGKISCITDNVFYNYSVSTFLKNFTLSFITCTRWAKDMIGTKWQYSRFPQIHISWSKKLNRF